MKNTIQTNNEIKNNIQDLSKEQLKNFYIDLVVKNTELKINYDEVQSQLQYYKDLIMLQNKRTFGKSSEKMIFDEHGNQMIQMSMFDEIEIESNPELEEPIIYDIIKPEKSVKGNRKYSKKLKTEYIDEEVIEYDVPAAEQSCFECGGHMHKMSCSDFEELVYIKAHLKKGYPSKNSKIM